MNGYLIAAGGGAAFTVLVHLIGGHFNPVLPMLRVDFDRVAKRTMHACWHMVSLHLILSSVALFAAGLAPERYGADGLLAGFVALQFVGYTMVVVVIALGTRVGLAAMPQPVLFVPVIILAWLGR